MKAPGRLALLVAVFTVPLAACRPDPERGGASTTAETGTGASASDRSASGGAPSPRPSPPRSGGEGDPGGTATPTPAPATPTPATAAPTPATAAPTPATAAPTPATAAPAPATPTPATALFRAATVEEPGGPVPLTRDGQSLVGPAARFRLELAGAVGDARLVLVDSAEAMVPADGAREVGTTTRLTLVPAAPLTPGSRYVLRVEGADTRELHDASGNAYGPVALALVVAGAPPAPEPKAKTRSKRTRRR